MRSILVLLSCILLPLAVEAGGYLTFTSGEEITRNDVTVEIEGKSVDVTDFFAVDTSAPSDVFLQNPAGRRQFVFLFDLLYSKPEDLVQARKTTVDLLGKTAKDDLYIVAGISRAGLKIFCYPTSDLNQVIAGLNAIGKDHVDMVQGPEGNYYSAKFSPADRFALLSDEQFQKNLDSLGLKEKKKNEDAFVFTQGLVDLSNVLAALNGRKSILLFSPGYETKGISLNLDLEKKRNNETKGNSESDPASLDTITNSFRDMEAVAAQGPAAHRPRSDHGVEVIPELFSGSDSHVFVISPAGMENGFYKDLSSKTQGAFCSGTCTTDAFLEQSGKYYALEWNTSKQADWKALNSVKISAGSKKVEATNRWLVERPFSEQSADERRMHLAEAIYKDVHSPSANTRIWVDTLYEDGINKIPVFIQVPGADILKTGQNPIKLEFYAYAIDRNGSMIDFASNPVELDSGNDKLKDRLSSSGLKVWNVLLGEQKPLMVRCIMVNSTSGEIFGKSVFIDTKATDLMMSNPFVPATNFNWIVWPKPQDDQIHRNVTLSYPYRLNQDLFFPDLTPEIAAKNNKGIVYFRIYNMLPESKNPPVKFQLLDSKGKTTELPAVHLMQKPKDIEHTGMELFWDLSPLPGVDPGLYRFRIGILDPLRKQVVVREIQNLKIS